MHIFFGCLLLISLVLMRSTDSSQECLSSGIGIRPFRSFNHTPIKLVDSPVDSLRPLYDFARAFLQAVQPNSFPKDIVSRVFKNKPQDIAQLVRYEAGYLVCLILAVLYLLAMPIAGGVLARQHCHGKKAQMNNHPSKLNSCYHINICVAVCLIFITIALMAGVILAFTANNRTRSNIRPSMHNLNANIRIIEDSLQSIPQKLHDVLNEYDVPKTEISKAINDADTVGVTIVSSLNRDFKSTLSNLSTTVLDAIGTIESLQIFETMRRSLQSNQLVLDRFLQDLKYQLTNIRCTNCSIPSTTNLETDANYMQIPSVQDKQDAMPPKSDVEGLFENTNSSIHGIPKFCSNQMAPTIADLNRALNRTQESLANTSRNFPSLQSLTAVVSELRSTLSSSDGTIEYYDYVRWAVAVTLCTVFLVIVLLMVAALALGLPVLFHPTVYSSHPNQQLENTALSLFQSSIALSLAVSWLVIVLVFVTLFFGGNAHTLGCRSTINGELFEFLDEQNEFFLSLSRDNQSIQYEISTSEIYRGCEKGQSLFHSMHMSRLFDIEDFLNASKYLNSFDEIASNMSINLDQLTLLPGEGRKSLLDFRNIGIENFSYDQMLMLLDKPVVKRDLAAFAESLEEKAKLPQNQEIEEFLISTAVNTRRMDLVVKQQEAAAVNMSISVDILRNISHIYKGNADRTFASFKRTEEALHSQVPLILANVSRCTVEKSTRLLLRYLDWVRHAILIEIMGCRWLARSLRNVYTAACLNVIDPWNGFWLSLGWCCALLVPGVIFSIYVARRLKPVTPTSPEFISKNTF